MNGEYVVGVPLQRPMRRFFSSSFPFLFLFLFIFPFFHFVFRLGFWELAGISFLLILHMNKYITRVVFFFFLS